MSNMIEPYHQSHNDLHKIDTFLTRCNMLYEDPYQEGHPSHEDAIATRNSLSYVEEFLHQHGCSSVPMKWLKEIVSLAEGEDWSRLARYIKDANNEFSAINRVYNDVIREMKKRDETNSHTVDQQHTGGRTFRKSFRPQHVDDHPETIETETMVAPLRPQVQYIRNENSESLRSTRRHHEETDMYAHHSHRNEHLTRQLSNIDDQLRSELRLPLEKINEPPTPEPYMFKDPEVLALEAITRRENTKRKEVEMAKIKQNNPHFTDLSDNNRPTKIAERYSQMYDNLWTDAHEELTTLYNQHAKGERTAVLDLAVILKAAFDFTSKHVNTQVERIAHQTRELMIDPCSDSQQETDVSDPFRHDKLLGQFASVCIKDTADLSVKALQKHFLRYSFPENSVKTKIKNIPAVKKYTDKCVELTWFMNVQDPPMVLVWPDMVEFDSLTDYFRYFTLTGTYLDHEVWPALLLCKDGPMIVKGVAQFKGS